MLLLGSNHFLMNSMFAMLSDRRLRRLGGAKRLESDRIPKDTLYGELTEGKRKAGRPLLRSEDTCKRDLKQCYIDIDTWEKKTNDRPACLVPDREPGRESRRGEQEATAVQRRQKRKEGRNQPSRPSSHVCTKCNRECRSRVGLCSHSHSCQRQ